MNVFYKVKIILIKIEKMLKAIGVGFQHYFLLKITLWESFK